MDAVELLHDMVSIPSLSGEEATLALYLVERMEALGFEARVDEVGNAVGVLGEGPREIVLLGHLDTVPGGPPVEIRGGRLWGRGSVDAKGPLAAFVLAAAGLGAVAGWRIVVIGAVEEEAASSKGARHVVHGFRPDACVIGEPSGWDSVTLGYKGRLVIEASRRQPTVHGAAEGTSAAERLVDYWNVVAVYAERLNEGYDRVFDRLQRRLEGMAGGLDGDQESGRLTIGFRLPPRLEPDDLRRELVRLPGSGEEIAFEVLAAEPAYVGERSSPLVQSFLRALGEAGARPRRKVKTGTSDMNVVAPVWRCPIVAYGPGDSRLDHTPEEHVVLEDYLKAIGVLREVLADLTSAEGFALSPEGGTT